MVDVQHRALRSLEHQAVPFAQRPVQQQRRIGHERPNLLRCRRIFLVHLRGIERLRAEQRVRNRILLPACVLDVRLQQIRVQQIHHPQPVARHLVFIGGPDAAACGANLLPTRRALRRQLDHPVIRQDHLRPV